MYSQATSPTPLGDPTLKKDNTENTPVDKNNTVVENGDEPSSSLESLPITENDDDKDGAVLEEEKEKTENQIIDDTVLVDIETSSYDELVFWCRRLGLDFSGAKSALQDRLKKLYDVSGSSNNKKKDGDTIKIESAKKTQYYKIEEIDEDYIRIIGDVQVLLEESGDGGATAHKITADYIIFNKKQKIMTAYGHVLYEKKSGDSTDFFKGDSLVFNIKSWEGIIYHGVSEKEKESSGEGGGTNTFYYSGEKLIKGKNDKIKMINGKISSSEGDFPVYSISASNIWVLGPGEWAIKNATMKVGEVPVMYLPFFLKWGDHFIFNPAVGKSDEVGQYLNLTYYLLGKKEEKGSADSFNFLDPGDGSEGSGQYVDGLFLRNGKPKEDENSDLDKSNDKKNLEKENIDEQNDEELSESAKKFKEWKKTLKSDWENVKANEETYIKLMADSYTNIGQFVGLEGSLKGFSHIASIEFDAGIGISYLGKGYSGTNISDGIDLTLKSSITDFDDVEANGLTDDNSYKYYGLVVDHSYLFGYLVPFRYGFSASMLNYKNPNVNWTSNISMELYSDSYYKQHFKKYRLETFNFEKAIGLSEEEETYESPPSINNLYWKWTNKISSIEKKFPKNAQNYIKSLSIKRFDFDFQFIKNEFNDTFLNYDDSVTTGMSTVVKEYFVPAKMTLPALNISMSGNLFNTSYGQGGKRIIDKNKSEESEDLTILEGIKSPWENIEKKSEEKEKAEKLKSADLFADLKLTPVEIDKVFSHSLDYNIKSLNMQLVGKFIADPPETPTIFHQLGQNRGSDTKNESIIKYQLSEMFIKLMGDFNLVYKASVLDNLITLTDTLEFSSAYQHTFYSNKILDDDSEEASEPSRDEIEAENLELAVANKADMLATKLKLTNSLTVAIKPFKFCID